MAKKFINELGVVSTINETQSVTDLSKLTDMIKEEAGDTIFAPYELWLKIGQSNSVGTDSSGTILYDTLDAPHPRVFEVSRGINMTGRYYAAPVGQIMKYQVPAQDDFSGIGFGLNFGKTRVNMNPSIKKLLVVNRGVGGTGFTDNRWNSGNDLYIAAVNEVNNTLSKYPEFKFMGFVWHQGESDAGRTQSFYETALANMVQSMRNDIKGASDKSVFIVGTMVESWIAANEASRRPIDLAHRNIANYIPNSGFADFSDLTILQDSIHFGTGSLRIMGKRYAYVASKVLAKSGSSPYNSHLFKNVNGKFEDVWNQGNIFGNVLITNDVTRNRVLNTNFEQGYQTDISMNPNKYTKFAWVKLLSIPIGFGNLLSGLPAGDTSLTNAHYWGWAGYGNGGTSPNQNRGLSNDLIVGTWVHVALVFTGSEFKYYVNGVLIETGTLNTSIISAPAMLQIGTFGSLDNNGLNCLMDSIGILPYAVDNAGALALLNL